MTRLRTLENLIDVEEIKQLKARYIRLLDAREWESLAAVFTQDARIVSASNPDGVDVETFIAGVSRSTSIVAGSMHQAYLPEITLTSETTARGLWAVASIHPPEDLSLHWGSVIPEGIPYREEYLWLLEHALGRDRLVYHGYGRYVDEFRKEDGEWRITSLHQWHERRDAIPATVLRMNGAE